MASLGFEGIAQTLGIPIWALVLVMIWTLTWKALALWKSARKTHLVWFIVFILVHTLGILEILYIFVFSKIKLGRKAKPVKKAKKK